MRKQEKQEIDKHRKMKQINKKGTKSTNNRKMEKIKKKVGTRQTLNM